MLFEKRKSTESPERGTVRVFFQSLIISKIKTETLSKLSILPETLLVHEYKERFEKDEV